MMWVIVTGKGEAYIINAPSAAMATTRFQKSRPGAQVAQCYEVTILEFSSDSDDS
jgi:hypothetical protein